VKTENPSACVTVNCELYKSTFGSVLGSLTSRYREGIEIKISG
jgi:hypothetical protein